MNIRQWCLWHVEAAMRCCQLWMGVHSSYITTRCRLMMRWKVRRRIDRLHSQSLRRKIRRQKIGRLLILIRINQSWTRFTMRRTENRVLMNGHLLTKTLTLCLWCRIRWSWVKIRSKLLWLRLDSVLHSALRTPTFSGTRRVKSMIVCTWRTFTNPPSIISRTYRAASGELPALRQVTGTQVSLNLCIGNQKQVSTITLSRWTRPNSSKLRTRAVRSNWVHSIRPSSGNTHTKE